MKILLKALLATLLLPSLTFAGASVGGAFSGGGGNVNSVMGNSSSIINDMTPTEGKIDLRGIDIATVTSDGFYFPDTTKAACVSDIVAESQACWATDTDELCIGDGAGGQVCIGGGGAGDITDVLGCSTGDCSSIAGADGDLIDLSAINPNTAGTEGLILPQASSCSGGTTDGQECWEADTDILKIGNGSGLTTVGPVTLDQAYDKGKIVDGANSSANAVIIGDGTDAMRIYVGTNGPTVECVLDYAGTPADCDLRFDVASSKSFKLFLDGTQSLTISDTGTVTLGSLLQETHVLEVPAGMATLDGAQCTQNTTVTLGSTVYPATVTCTDNDAATIQFEYRSSPQWDAGTIVIEIDAHKDSADVDGAINIDWSAHCTGDGDAHGAGSFGTEVAMDFDPSSDAADDQITAASAAITPSGTCVAGDRVQVQGQVDATGTAATAPEDLHIVSFIVKETWDTW